MSDKNKNNHSDTVYVWDKFIRFFHWGMVSCVVVSFISGKAEVYPVHYISGYILAALILARIYWGFAGPKHVRWTSFFFSPKEMIGEAKGIITNTRPKNYPGHNPLASPVMLGIFIVILGLIISGMLVVGIEDQEGPFASLHTSVDKEVGEILEEVHETLVGALMLLIVFHLLGLTIATIQYKENIFKTMITGRRKKRDE